MHRLDATGVRIENMSAVLEVVADKDVYVAISIQIRKRERVREPSLARWNDIDGKVIARANRRGQSWFSGLAQKRNGRSAPVIDQYVHQAVLIEVGGQTAHRRHR